MKGGTPLPAPPPPQERAAGQGLPSDPHPRVGLEGGEGLSEGLLICANQTPRPSGFHVFSFLGGGLSKTRCVCLQSGESQRSENQQRQGSEAFRLAAGTVFTELHTGGRQELTHGVLSSTPCPTLPEECSGGSRAVRGPDDHPQGPTRSEKPRVPEVALLLP